MARILIIGGSGSGKTTLARRIAATTNTPVHHLDPLIFFNNWKTRPEAEILNGIDQITLGEKWVFEGSFAPAFDRQVARATMVIFLDIPTHIRLWRVVARSLGNYGKSLPEHPEDCKMMLRWWLIRLVINYRKSGRLLALALLKKLPKNVRGVHISTQNDIDNLMATL